MISFTAKAHCQPHRCAAPTIPMPTITTTDRTCVSASSAHSARPSLKWTAMASKSRLCLVCQLVRRTSKKEPSWKERWSACCKQSHCRSGAESPEASDLLRLRGVQEEPKLQLKPALTSTVDVEVQMEPPPLPQPQFTSHQLGTGRPVAGRQKVQAVRTEQRDRLASQQQ